MLNCFMTSMRRKSGLKLLRKQGPIISPPRGSPWVCGQCTYLLWPTSSIDPLSFWTASKVALSIVSNVNLSPQGVLSKTEYSGIFLPSLNPPSSCMTGGMLHSPIVIAWSGSGYNHFIPLVPIKDQPLPWLPKYLQPKVWFVSPSYYSIQCCPVVM